MLQTQRGPAAHQDSAIVISPDGFRLVKLRQTYSTSGENKKLGFSLRGGREATGSSVGVFVSHVELAGQANKNGLKVGDQLIQVNGLQVSQATYEEVIELIRRTPKCDEICLLVKYVGRIPFQERTGQPIRWLQIELDDTNLQVADTDEHHQLLLDDLDGATKLSTNERLKVSPTGQGGARKSSNYQDDSAASSQSLTFTSGASSSCSGASIEGEDDDEEAEPEITLLHVGGVVTEEEEEACQMVSSAASSSSGCSISMSSVQSSSSEMTARADGATPVRVPGGRRTSEPFGCGVVKGPDEWPGIFVQNVKPASLAERVGLEPGDQLVRAGDQQLSQLPFEQAIALIKTLQQQQDELLLLVRKGAALRHLAECKSQHRQQQQHHDLKSPTDQALVASATRRRKPLEPPPAPPSSSRQHEQQVSAESVSRAQQVDQTKSSKGDSQAAAVAASQQRQGQMQKQADSSIRFGAASGPSGNGQQPRQRRQTTTTTATTTTALIGNAKSQQESAATGGCCTTSDEQRTGWHAKPEDKNERPSTGCTKTIRAPQRPPPKAADRSDAAVAAANVVRTEQQECSAERECQCDTTGRASQQPPEDRLPSTTTTTTAPLGARQQRAPTARHRPSPCSSPIVVMLNGQQRQRNAHQVAAASDNDDATSSSSSPLVVNQQLRTHPSPRSMKLNYDSGGEGEEEEVGESARSAANQHDDLASQSRDSKSCRNRNLNALANVTKFNANEQQTGNLGSHARNKQDKGAETMRSPASHTLEDFEHAQDDDGDEQDLQEEIKIVKQNCKLHHHSSMHSLAANSRLFYTPNDLKQRSAASGGAPVEPAKVIKSKAPPPPPPARSLQRYVSMDNLSQPQQQQHNHLLILHQQQQLNRYKRLHGCPTSRHKSTAPQPPVSGDSATIAPPIYRRSNSVLGQPIVSSECCRLAQHQHQLQLLRDQAAHKQLLSLTSRCNCLSCQQQQRVAVTSKTMRHAPRACGPPLVSSRPCSVTLSKFKARSEDKLNLMHMNLNYATSKQQQVLAQLPVAASNCTGSGSARLVRLQQARLASEQQQARQSALVGGKRQQANHDSAAARWLAAHHQQQAPCTATCCVANSRAGLLRPVACHMDRGAPTQQQQLVYNYTTATGMIATSRGAGMSSAASCCAINELTGEQLSRARKSNRTNEMLLLEQRLIIQQQQNQRHPTTTCCSCRCCSSSSMRAFRMCKSHTQQTGGGCGASTDSSGYQSTSGGERPQVRAPACPPTPSQQRDTRTRLSTFNPQPNKTKKTLVAPAATSNISSTPTSIEISSCGSSGSLGSATCSPSSTSSSISSSCSPLSSPHYLSSTPSSCNSAACGKPAQSRGGGASKVTTGHYEVSALMTVRTGGTKLTKTISEAPPNDSPKPRLLARSKPLGTPTRGNIPCPPPMPLLDDNSQTLRAPTAPAASSQCRRKQEPRRQSTTSGESAPTVQASERVASKPTGGGDGGGRSNKLCFVDELKMLASQQQANTEISGGGVGGSRQVETRGVKQRPGESATLIKIINANKKQTQQLAGPRGNKCSCCPASAGSECSPRPCDCKLSAAAAKSKCCCPNASAGKSAPVGCRRGRPSPSSSSGKPEGSSAASKLRDEEYTKRRQHELLMEEFKTAHSKMFNKLRQKQTDNQGKNEQQEIQANGDVYDVDDDDQGQDGDDRPANAQSDDDMGQQQQQRSRTATAATGNLVIRPRTTVATN